MSQPPSRPDEGPHSVLDRVRAAPRSLRRFVVTGSLGVLLDAAVYSSLLHLNVPVDWAKGSALVVATIFAYFTNRFWAFSDAPQKSNRMVPFLILYAAVIGLNVLVNRLSLMVVGASTIGLFISWFLATAASASFNYVGMRFFVFRKQAP